MPHKAQTEDEYAVWTPTVIIKTDGECVVCFLQTRFYRPIGPKTK
jgi:hypothetical protein